MKQASWIRSTAKSFNNWRRKPSILKGTRWSSFIEWKRWKDKKNEQAKALDEILNGLESKENKQKSLLVALKSDTHPLGLITRSFGKWVNMHYSRARVPLVLYQNQDLLEDYQSFLSKLN